MKSVAIHIISLALILLSIACNEDDLELDGEYKIEGVVLYRDVHTNLLDTAKNAEIEVIGHKSFKLSAETGKFNIGVLPAGTYTLKFIFSANNSKVTYRHERNVTLNSSNASVFDIFTLEIDPEQDYALAILEGTLLYQDELSDFNNKVAKGSVVLNSKNGLVKLESEADTHGKFIFSKIPSGIYTFDAFYSEDNSKTNSSLNYSHSQEITINKNEKLLLQPPLVLKIDTVNFLSAYSKVVVRDKEGNRIGNTKVCLFSNETYISDGASCEGSVVSAISNDRGIVIFDGLDPVDYFITAHVKIGSKELRQKLGSKISANDKRLVTNVIELE